MNQSRPVEPLRQRVIRALGWSIGGQIANYALRLFSTLIMTRLLAPESYGLLAIATVVMVIVSLLADVGLRQSVVRSRRGDDIEFLDTAFSVQVIRGAALAGVILLVALVFAVLGHFDMLGSESTYAHPLLPSLIGASALPALILGFQSMKLFQVDRHLQVSLTFKLELMTQLVTMLVTIAIAVPTRSVWSVVIGGLTGNVCHVLLTRYWLPGHRDQFGWNRSALTELVSFGRWVLLSSALTGITMNGDRLLLAAFTSPANLGLYAIALNLLGLASGIVSRIAGTVSLGAISQVARLEPERLPSIVGRIRFITDFVMIACAGFVFVVAKPIIVLLYDVRYEAAGGLLQILSFSMIFYRSSLAQQVYAAIGRPKYLVIVSAGAAFALYSVVPIGLFLDGFQGAVIAIALREAPILPLLWILNTRCGIRMNSIAHEFVVLAAWPLGFCLGQTVIVLGSAMRAVLG